MNILKILILSFALSGGAVAGEVILHTATAHIGAPGLEHFTPGVAYQFYSGYRFGVLRNSYKVTSLYAAKVMKVNRRVRVGVGIITGYDWSNSQISGKENGAIPLLAIEADITKNISILWMGQALNMELKF